MNHAEATCLTESTQLAYLGLAVTLARLTLDMFDPSDALDVREVDSSILSSLEVSPSSLAARVCYIFKAGVDQAVLVSQLVEQVVVFVEAIEPSDLTDKFWISCG